jgi:kynurenine formamidase
MPEIIDLTMPIENHFRWKVERSLAGSYDAGDPFQVTRLGLVVHGFTHMDAPVHMVPGGDTTSDIALERTIGPAAILDLTDVAPRSAIDAQRLERAGAHVEPGDIVVLKTRWDERVSNRTPEFWRESPWLTREACEWLLAREPRALAVDFPQDYPIRLLLDGEHAPISQFVSHDVLLRNGVILIEYVCNLGAVKGPRTTIFCLPLKLPGADGAPARVIAVE